MDPFWDEYCLDVIVFLIDNFNGLEMLIDD
jgi:hypothetical protein